MSNETSTNLGNAGRLIGEIENKLKDSSNGIQDPDKLAALH
jgi:hypothetical protein